MKKLHLLFSPNIEYDIDNTIITLLYKYIYQPIQ